MCQNVSHHGDGCSCQEASHQTHHHAECGCGEQKAGWRRYMTREEKRKKLEEYAVELEAELAAVRELLNEKKK